MHLSKSLGLAQCRFDLLPVPHKIVSTYCSEDRSREFVVTRKTGSRQAEIGREYALELVVVLEGGVLVLGCPTQLGLQIRV
jgi:hypothetical protein